MADIELIKENNVYMQVLCDKGIALEISEFFTFYVDGYKFMAKYKNGMWDGKIRLFNLNTRQIYCGLLYKLHKFSKERGYSLKVDKSLIAFNKISFDDVEEYFNQFVNTNEFELRDYQLESITDCLHYKRKLLLSPTSSGKSLIIYLICRILTDLFDYKVLITATSTGLVEQMVDDFHSYQKPDEEKLNISKIYSGHKHDSKATYTVSTWQSIYKKDPEWFNQFDVVICDEAHSYKAVCLKSMLEKTTDIQYKFGFTGTLDESVSNKLVLEGLFGPVVTLISTKELIDQGYIADIVIYCLIFEYSKEDKNKLQAFLNEKSDKKTSKYQKELDFLCDHEKRNGHIVHLLENLKKNSLTLFQYVDKHGKILYNKLSELKDDVFFIHGGASVDYRKNAKKTAEEKDNVDLIASYGTFQQGESVKRIHNLILGSPSKSKIRVLQSLGRGLRKGSDKSMIKVFDIVDDLSKGNNKNYAMKHFKKRYEYYIKEGFKVVFKKVQL